ncbi:MAG: hypothetical protein ACK5PB_00015 [Pirellula sp.]|jgi:uncharacterized repeat protein (TIGR01451 family)
MMIVRNQKIQWMLGVAVCSIIGCQTTNVSVPLTAQLGPSKITSDVTASLGQGKSLPSDTNDLSAIKPTRERTIRLVQHSEPQDGTVQSEQSAATPHAMAVAREPMAYSPAPYFETQPGAPIYSTMAPHAMGSNMAYGQVATPVRPLVRNRPRIHAGGAYQPIFNRADGSCTTCGTCETDASCACEPSDFAFAVPRESDPQEYLFDGGDQEPKVRVRRDNSYIGLDPEDTVIQYETMDGKVHVDSGCRVAIYAPRFASVRKRYNPVERDQSMQVINVAQPHGPKMAQNILPPIEERAQTRYVADSQTRIVEAVRQGVKPLPAETMIAPIVVIEEQDTLALLDLLTVGLTQYRDKQALLDGILAAREWSTPESIGVLENGAEPMSVIGNQGTNGVTHYERKGARIRLCKVASEQMAHPGDTIQFVIRFDNVGEQPVSNLVVTDSLTGRLEYVPDTQKSTRDAQFVLTPNGAGSETLRWELQRELGPGEGGLISFECKVR